MPFDFISFDSIDFGSTFDFSSVTSVVDTSGTEFLSSIGAVGDFGTTFDVPISDLASIDAWSATGSFAGSADWFDTFNSGSILSSIPSVGDFSFSSITDSFPSLSSFTDGAKSLGDSISAGYTAVKDSLPSLDKIKSVADTVSKEVGTIAKDAQKVLASYQKIAPAVNAATNALGIQNPINQIIQPLTAAVSVVGGAASAAGGVSSGIDSARKTGSSISDFFGPSPTEKAETYNQAVKTVESTDTALKQYDSEKATYTADIVRTSDNIYAIQNKLEDPNISEEERAVAQEQLKGEYDKLAVSSKSLEQTNAAAEAVTTARDSAAKVVATTDLKSIKAPYTVDSSGLVVITRSDSYNQAVATVDSTNAALKQYDDDRKVATADIVKTSDNIYNINQRLENPNTSAEERAILEDQLKGEYVKLSETQKVLEQTNAATAAVTTARDSAAKVVAGTASSSIFSPAAVSGTPEKSETYNQAKATVDSTNAALKQYENDRKVATADIVKTSDNIYNINQRLENPNTTAEERAILEEQLKGEYVKLSETQKVLEQTNAATEAVTAARDSAAKVVASTDTSVLGQAAAVFDAGASKFKTAYDSVTKTFSVFDSRTGQTVQTGLTQQQATAAENNLNISSGITLTSVAASVSAIASGIVGAGANAISSITNLFTGPDGANATSTTNTITVAQTNQARAQQTIRELRNTKAQSTDWRVRLRLAPNSNYLYNAPQPGILSALKLTDGVIFPYTPSIETAYKANYDPYDLTHSNYRGYFYKGSYVDAVNIRGTFTAQDTKEGDYLLAVIHFFRSCTKMFYGQDTQRGSPPPLVYLNGYGDYQFAEHPCVVSQFNYTLPPDVDYIRCQSTLQNNTNRLNSRLRNPLSNNPLSYSVNRLLNSSLVAGALTNSPLSQANNLASSTPTYVPTKMEISITLLPIQSRSQISNNFSVKEFANGNLLKGGYW
jgi:hypothetical protein